MYAAMTDGLVPRLNAVFDGTASMPARTASGESLASGTTMPVSKLTSTASPRSGSGRPCASAAAGGDNRSERTRFSTAAPGASPDNRDAEEIWVGGGVDG